MAKEKKKVLGLYNTDLEKKEEAGVGVGGGNHSESQHSKSGCVYKHTIWVFLYVYVREGGREEREFPPPLDFSVKISVHM